MEPDAVQRQKKPLECRLILLGALRFWPRSAGALHRRRISWEGWTGRNLSLFPLFTPAGNVTDLLVIAPETGELFLMPWRAGGPIEGGWRHTHLGNALEAPAPLRREDLARIGQRLHYDPWWLLDAPAFASHWAVDPLKRTNCVPRLPDDLKTLLYARDLSAVRHAVLKGREGSPSLIAWRTALPTESSVIGETGGRPAKHSDAQWKLDPIWQVDTEDPWGLK